MKQKIELSDIVKAEVNMVELLIKLGYHGIRRGQNYFFKSPLRDENTASFSVHPTDNVWKDWGDGSHGNIIDFGERKFGTLKAFYKEIFRLYPSLKTQERFTEMATVKPKQEEPKKEKIPEIKIIQVKPLWSYPLLNYIKERRIPEYIANQFCKEVTYELHEKLFYAIGFPNDSGGYALRNKYIKLASMPNDHTLIQNGSKSIALFEGFFDFLSYKTINHKMEVEKPNYLILNTTSFFGKALTILQKHERILWYGQNDKGGNAIADQAKDLLKERFIDNRPQYAQFKDLNKFLTDGVYQQKSRLNHRL